MRAFPPPLYLSHGSPMIAVEPGRTQAFFQRLGPAIDRAFGRPPAVVVVSAHTMHGGTAVLGAVRHHAIHDFSGFPPALYALRYDAPGDPALAQRIGEHVAAAGIAAPVLPDEGGLDHGIWTALMHLWPEASVPVVPVVLPEHAAPQEVWRVGRAAMQAAAEAAPGALLLGTGSLTHNLRRVFQSGRFGLGPYGVPEDEDCRDFRTWVLARAGQGDWPALLDYRAQAPHAAAMHPTDEHWRPFYFAAGAASAAGDGAATAGTQVTGQRVHEDVEFGCLAMDAYAFGPQARALIDALA